MSGINWHQVITDNILSFIFGTLVFGTVLELIRKGINFIWTKKYRGWTLKVTPMTETGRKAYVHDLLWDEVRRFEESQFEKRKFIQSVCTSENIRIRAGEIATDNADGWVFVNHDQKQYCIDFPKMPAEMRA
jgi:hypothetical protein